jgi:hypothetical protein
VQTNPFRHKEGSKNPLKSEAKKTEVLLKDADTESGSQNPKHGAT